MNWDWGSIFNISFTTDFWLALASIIFINIILSGDNAVVIALAVRSLARRQRLQGIILGTGLAVVFRIVLTFFCAKLLEISFLKFVGGWLIAWIAVKLFIEGTGDRGKPERDRDAGESHRDDTDRRPRDEHG